MATPLLLDRKFHPTQNVGKAECKPCTVSPNLGRSGIFNTQPCTRLNFPAQPSQVQQITLALPHHAVKYIPDTRTPLSIYICSMHVRNLTVSHSVCCTEPRDVEQWREMVCAKRQLNEHTQQYVRSCWCEVLMTTIPNPKQALGIVLEGGR